MDLLQNDETDQETSESDRESTQTSSIGRTSLGRTILNAFNERSLFNKKVYESLNIIYLDYMYILDYVFLYY